MKLERILVPVDYSTCSSAALRCAAGLAKSFGATLDIVHVWDRPSYVTDIVMTATDPMSSKSLLRKIQENAERDLSEFLKSADAPGVALTGRLISGEPAAALLRELEHGKYDLVVVGTHGRTGLSRALLGSVAEKLVQLSRVPVLTVPDEAAVKLRA